MTISGGGLQKQYKDVIERTAIKILQWRIHTKTIKDTLEHYLTTFPVGLYVQIYLF